MNKFKVLLCAALVLGASNVFAAKDFQAVIPTGNFVMAPFDGMEAFQKIVDKNIGRNVVCNLWALDQVPVKVQIDAVNYQFDSNDSPNGVYTVTPSTPVNFRKFNCHPIVSNYFSTIRLSNLNQAFGQNVVVNCFYF
jgi:hypothetical protein